MYGVGKEAFKNCFWKVSMHVMMQGAIWDLFLEGLHANNDANYIIYNF